MSHVKTFCGVVGMTVLVTAGAGLAQSFNRTTYLTFSTPVELPGVTLPAGTYTFRLSDSTSDRHVVQVLDKDAGRLHATILAMPARRLHADKDTVVTFHELPAEATPAVRYWYYPGDDIGQEFAYPRDQAMRLAAASGEPVLAVDSSEPSMTSQVTRVESDAADAQTGAGDDRATGTSGTGRLPQTASHMPLVGLLGLLALAGAAVVRVARASV